MTKYRLRVKGSRRAAKPIGGSCSSNPTSIKFRLAAKAQRMAKLSPLIPVDEIKEQPVGDAALLKQLPMNEMSLGERRPKYKSPGSQFDAGYEEPERNEKQQLQKRPELLDQIKEETSPEDKQRLLKREHQIWQILPSHLSSSPPDYKTTMPILAPILGASLNERPDLRLTALSSIRAALQMDAEHGFNIMEQFAKNFLPILFSLYTNIDAREEQTNASPKFDPQAVHLSTLETIRLFMRQAPKELIKQYIKAAVQKLASEEGNDGKQQQKSGGGGEDADKKLLLADLLIGMCISADIEDIQLVFNCFRSWFGDVGRRQKKAYRLLAQIYQRIDEPELEPFFRSNRPFLAKLIEAGHETVDKSAYQWRIAVYRNVIQTFHIHEFEELSHFCASIDEELFAFLDPENSSPTRQQATNCLVEMAAHLVNLCPSDGPNPLESLFSKLFKTVKATVKSTVEDEDGSNKRLQCALLALNILSQKRIRQANATLLSQLLGHTADALQATDPKNRVLAIRLMRTICAKMQPFMFEQFKDLILHAVFAQSTKDPTVRLRKSNALLLELLLESLGIEELLKFAANKMVWVKMLKNLEKRRRRRQRKGQKMGNGDLGTMLPSAGSGRRSSRSGASTVVSSAQSNAAASSAISSLITLGARTAHVDSIFDLLEDSSDEEAENEQGRKSARQRRNSNRKSARLSVVLEEGAEEDDPLDLLDRKAVQSRLTLVKKNTKMEMNKKKRKLGTSEEEEEEQMDGPFRRNKEGKLLITDLDEKRQTKRRRKAEKEVEEEDEEKGDEQKNGRVEGDEDLDEDE